MPAQRHLKELRLLDTGFSQTKWAQICPAAAKRWIARNWVRANHPNRRLVACLASRQCRFRIDGRMPSDITGSLKRRSRAASGPMRTVTRNTMVHERPHVGARSRWWRPQPTVMWLGGGAAANQIINWAANGRAVIALQQLDYQANRIDDLPPGSLRGGAAPGKHPRGGRGGSNLIMSWAPSSAAIRVSVLSVLSVVSVGSMERSGERKCLVLLEEPSERNR